MTLINDNMMRHPAAANRVIAYLTAFALLIVSTGLFANETGQIRGQITDSNNGNPLHGANVILVGTLLGASTDADGYYVVKNVPTGEVELLVNYIGYSQAKQKLSIDAGSVTDVNLALDPSAIMFDQIVITGSRQTESLAEATNSVNVMGHADIFERTHHLVAGALQELPAVDLIGENISVRGGSGYSFLGVGGSRVLMMIDDVPMLTSDFSRANWDFLPATEFERAEVLKGASSVMYGSGGISAVVNLISRRPTEKPRFSYRTTGGLYSDPNSPEWQWTEDDLYFYGTDFSYSQSIGPVGIQASVSRYFNTGWRDNSDLDRWYFTARPVINFGNGSNVSMFFAYNREERGLFALWESQNRALSTDYEDRAEVDGLLFSAVYNQVFSPKFVTKLRFSLNSQLLGLPLDFTRGFEPALGFSGEARGVWLPNSSHTVTFGVDYRRDIAESGFFGKHIANTYSPYIQDNWKVTERMQINMGVRQDFYLLDDMETDGQLSPKFGISLQPFENTTVHSSIGRGFRAPSIAERFTETDIQGAATLLSNVDLQPERATLYDIGIRQRLSDNFSLEIAGFISDYENLIELTQISDLNLVLQFRNCDKARIRGIEAETAMQFWKNRLRLRMNGTWMESESRGEDLQCFFEDGETLPYRPKFSGFVSPALALGPLTFEMDYRYISRFDRVSFFRNEQRVPQKTFNFRARYQWRQFMVVLQSKNAFNYQYTVVEQNIGELRNYSISFAGEF